jgi:Putative lumazine-binding
MKRFIFFLTALVCGNMARAQTTQDSIKMVIDRFFDGMRKSDTAMIRSAISANAVLQTIAMSKDGKLTVRDENINNFIASIAQPHTDIYDERITYGAIHIDGPMAAVWTPYKFYVGEKFSHCGVNSFQMVRLDGGWKIQYIIDTRRRKGCE